MIGIATIDYDEQGHITFDELPESNLNPPDARVTRTPTLSGGAVIHHSGYSDSDRVFDILAELNATKTDILKYIYKNFTLITIATPEGAFKGVMSRLEEQGGNVRIEFLVKE